MKLPDRFTNDALANEFLEFFDNKKRNLVNNFTLNGVSSLDLTIATQDLRLSTFREVDSEVVKSILRRVKLTNCESDPFPIRDAVNSENIGGITDIYVDLVNRSIVRNVFPESEKRAIVKQIIKGNMDAQCLRSYRPVSDLSFLSKLIENVVLDQLLEHMRLTNVLPDNQSAFR